MRKVGLLIAMTLLLVPATAMAQHDEHAMASLKEMTPKWQAAFSAGDAAGVAALYTTDGTLLPPNSAPVDGREAIEAFWSAALEGGATGELTAKSLYAMGDHAAEVGMFVLTNADGSHLDHGSYTLVYKMVDGGWQIESDIWNSDMSQ
jgi:uncharacterized protein (TIGR02246 family)